MKKFTFLDIVKGLIFCALAFAFIGFMMAIIELYNQTLKGLDPTNIALCHHRMMAVFGTGMPGGRSARGGVDIAYGGIIFAIVDAASLGFRITPDEAFEMCRLGKKIRAACNEQVTPVHPENPAISGVANIFLPVPYLAKMIGF